MSVNENGNYVMICERCNREKANKIILPSWYTYLAKDQQKRLERYMRYTRSWIRLNCKDEDILNYVEALKIQE